MNLDNKSDLQMGRSIEQTLSTLQPGDHLCCIYEDDQQHRDILVRFLRDGLEQGQKILYVFAEHEPTDILADLSASVPAFADARAKGQFELHSCNETYFPSGHFDPRAMLDLVRSTTEQSLADGYPALRFTGEMDCFIHGLPGSDKMPKFEALLNTIVADLQALILCQYHRPSFAPHVLMEVLLSHPRVILGQYVYDNFYYLPRSVFLSSDRDSIDLDHWLNNLTQRYQKEWQLEHARRDLSSRLDEHLSHLAEANEHLYAEIRARLGTEFALLQSNETLREAENRYKTIFDAATDAIFIVGPANRILEANQVACERFGYNRDELVQMTPYDFVPLSQHDAVTDRMQYLLTHDDVLTYELVHHTRSGRNFTTEMRSRRIKYENDWAILSVARDITAHKRAEQSLRDSEAKFRSLIENSPDGITLMDENGRIVEYSPGCERIFNIPSAQALGRSPTDIYFGLLPDQSLATPEAYAESEAQLQAVRQTGQADWLGISKEREILRSDGETRFIESLSFPIPTEHGFMVGTAARDVTEHHRAEQELEQYRHRLEMMVQQRTAELQQRTAELQHEIYERRMVEGELMKTNAALEIANAGLRESEERYRALVNQSPIAIFVLQDQRFKFVNPVGARRLGYEPSELIGMAAVDTVSPGSHRMVAINPFDATDLVTREPKVIQFACRDGSTVFSEFITVSILYEGRPATLILSQDVTDRTHYERQLEDSLAEKEVMLREIHHRVKNNLNVMVALIDLQKASQTDPQVLQVFKDLQARAYTMSLVHESLYRSPNLAQIDFAGYLQTLVDHLYSVYGPSIGDSNARLVKVQVQAEKVAFKIETAIPCGMIVNELVTNALKYAFPAACCAGDRQDCSIIVRLERHGLDQLFLSVSDNGIGLPPGIDWRAASTLGLQLIQVLARQVGGRIDLNTTQGMHWQLMFSERQ